MAVASGSKLGPYTILGPLGAGGMGEVYRARDERLGRDVAVKVLPTDLSSDPDRLRRFEQEARSASALNHPGILTVHDTGSVNGAPYIVSELLEGETLRGKMTGAALAPRRAIDYATQIALGLAAAHEKYIVHRDLKPENIFVTKDGRVKILDFGLAKLIVLAGDLQTGAPTAARETEPGVIMGTVGYMSPEQARGLPADHRSDIFSFGAIVYEMLSGRRAFKGASAVETLSAILKEDPPEFGGTGSAMPAGLEPLVRHCLEKDPDARFQSARDLAFQVQTIASSSAAPGTPAASGPVSRVRKGGGRALLGAAAIGVAAALAGFLAGRIGMKTTDIAMKRLTFRRGVISTARFAPDRKTVVYTARWDGEAPRTFVTSADSPESRLLDLPPSNLLSVSSKSDLLLLLAGAKGGTLARMPLSGGAPRELLVGVSEADWAPDGEDFAVVIKGQSTNRLEYPAGTKLHETHGAVNITSPHVSPRGDRVAFFESGLVINRKGTLKVVDRKGTVRTLTEEWEGTGEVFWHPGSSELYFSATDGTGAPSIRAVDPAGRQRVVARAPYSLYIQDIAGDTLLVHHVFHQGLMAFVSSTGEPERSIAWLDWSTPADLSEDGKTLLFTEGRDGGLPLGAVYQRETSGGAPVHLGAGTALALSRDGRWAAVHRRTVPHELVLLPTGAGESKRLTSKLEYVAAQSTAFSHDGRDVLVTLAAASGESRLYLQSVEGGEPRPVAAPESSGGILSPDDRFIAVQNPKTGGWIYPVGAGEPRSIKGLIPGEQIIRFSGDGSALFVRGVARIPAAIDRIEISSGNRTRLFDLTVADRAGIGAIVRVLVSADGRSAVYSAHRQLGDLYLMTGFR